jgi:hypothetical protein
MAVELKEDNKRMDSSELDAVHGVECVSRLSMLFKHPVLEALATANGEYAGLKNGVYLTGFKLEDSVIRTEGAIQNAKLIPLLNGDTMTLVNSNKSGILTLACTRTAAGIKGGDIVDTMDFIRSQGDSSGGSLEISWQRNGQPKKLTFSTVCVMDCPPLQLDGNDLPSYGIKLTYATFHNDDYPTWK